MESGTQNDPIPGDSTDPATSDPVTSDPVTSDPVTSDPVTSDPVTSDPVTSDPVTSDPATSDPATSDPVTQEDPIKKSLLLIDSRVPEIDGIVSGLTTDTDYIVFDYTADTYDTLKSQILRNYTNIGIAQHNAYMSNFPFLSDDAGIQLQDIENVDPTLITWGRFIEFAQWLRDVRGMQYLDLLACNIYSDPNWVYAITQIREQFGVHLRASLDITGYGGDFILESDNVNMIGIYFTELILNYKYAFDTIFQHGILLDNNDDLWVWGKNSSGQLGIGTNDVDRVPMVKLTKFDNGTIKSFGSASNTCYISYTNGNLYASGTNGGNRLLANTAITGATATSGNAFVVSDMFYSIASNKVVSFAGANTGSNSSTHILTTDGNVYSLGSSINNTAGSAGMFGNTQLGTATAGTVGVIYRMNNATGKQIVDLQCTSISLIVQMSDGTIYFTGNGRFCGASTTSTATLTQITLPNNELVSQVQCSSVHTGVLTTTGNVYLTGTNSVAQVNGTITPSLVTTWTQLSTTSIGKTPKAIALPGSNSIVLFADGTMYGIGENAYGQLGQNNTTNPISTLTKVPIPNNESVIQIKGYDKQNIVLTHTGNVYGCGQNTNNLLSTSAASTNILTMTQLQKSVSGSNVAVTGVKSINPIVSPIIVPGSIGIQSITSSPGLNELTVTLNTSSGGYPAVTNYLLAYDSSFSTVVANLVAPNVSTTLSELQNQQYTIYAKAISGTDWTSTTASSSATPYYTGTAPTINSIYTMPNYSPGFVGANTRVTPFSIPSNAKSMLCCSDYNPTGVQLFTFYNTVNRSIYYFRSVNGVMDTSANIAGVGFGPSFYPAPTSSALSPDGTKFVFHVNGWTYYGNTDYLRNGINTFNYTPTLDASNLYFNNCTSYAFTADNSRLVATTNTQIPAKILVATWNSSKNNYSVFTSSYSSSTVNFYGITVSRDGSRIAHLDDSSYGYLYWSDWNGTAYGSPSKIATSYSSAANGYKLSFALGTDIIIRSSNTEYAYSARNGTIYNPFIGISSTYMTYNTTIDKNFCIDNSGYIYFFNTASSVINKNQFSIITDTSNAFINIDFTPGTDGNPTTSAYYYAIDGCSNYINLNSLTSPAYLSNAPYGQHTITLKANAVSGSTTIWDTTTSAYNYAVPLAGSIPTIANIALGLNELTVTLNASTGGYPNVSNYLLAYDLSFSTVVANLVAPNVSTVLSGLSNQQYTIYAKAISGNSWTTLYDSSSVTPYYAGSASVSAVIPANNQLNALTLTFTTPVVGNPAPNVYYYSTDGGSTYSSTAETSITVENLSSAESNVVVYSSNIGIWNSNVSNSVYITPYYAGSTTVSAIIPENNQLNALTLTFTTPVVGNPAPNVYYYSTDGGSTYSSTAETSITVEDISSNQESNVVVYSSNVGIWNSNVSNSVYITPYYAGSTTVSAIIPENNQLNALTLTFTTPVVGNPVPNVYYYSTDGGTTYSNTTQTSITVENLSNQESNVVAYSSNVGIWDSAVSSSVYITPYYAGSASVSAIVPANNQLNALTLTFTTPVVGNPALNVYYYSTDGGMTYSSTAETSITVEDISSNQESNVVVYSSNVGIWNSNVSSSVYITPYYAGTASVSAIVPANNQLNALTLTFTTPVVGNPVPNVYYYSTDGGSTYSSTAETSITVEDLSSNQESNVVVYSSNVGIWDSAVSSSVYITPYYAGNMTISASIPVSNALNSLTLTFTTPVVGNPVPNVYYYSLNGGSSYTQIYPSASTTITDVPSQECNIVAYSSNIGIWDSVASNPVQITPYYVATDPSITTIDSSYQTMVVNFAPSTGGNPSPSYYYCALDSSASANFIYSGSTSPIVIGGLSTSGMRTVYLKSVGNVDGTTTIWTSNIVSASGQPYVMGSAPTIQSLVPSLNAITVNYAASTGGYPDPTNYLVAYDSTFTTIVANVAYPNTSTTLQGLSAQSYTVYIKAISDGIWTSAYDSSSTTPYYAGNVVVSAAPITNQLNALTLTFTTPVVGNPAPNVYYYSADGGNTYESTTSTSVTVSGLPNQICNVVAYSSNIGIWESSAYSVQVAPYYAAINSSITVDSSYQKLVVNFTYLDSNPAPTRYYAALDNSENFAYSGVASPITITNVASGVHTVYLKVVGNIGATTVWTSNIVSASGQPYIVGSTPTFQSIVRELNVLTVTLSESIGGYPDPTNYIISYDSSFINIAANIVAPNRTANVAAPLNQAYRLYAKAVSGTIWGTATRTSTATTPYYAGQPPTGITCTTDISAVFVGGTLFSSAVSQLPYQTMTIACSDASSTQLLLLAGIQNLYYVRVVNGTFEAIKTITRTYTSSSPTKPTATYCRTCALTADGNRMIAYGGPSSGGCIYWGDSSPLLNDTSSTVLLAQINDTTLRQYNGVAVTADGSRLVACTVNGNIGAVYFSNWNPTISNYDTFTQTLDTTNTAYSGLSMSRDGGKIVYVGTTTYLTYISVWNGSNYDLQATLDKSATIPRSIAFSSGTDMIIRSELGAGLYCSYWIADTATYSKWYNIPNIYPTINYGWGMTVDSANTVYYCPYSVSVANVAISGKSITLNRVNTATLTFTAGTNGNPGLTSYLYSLDNGAYVDSGKTTSPIVIDGLSGGTHTVALKSTSVLTGNTIWTSNASVSTDFYNIVTGSVPTIANITPGNGTLTVTLNPSTGGVPDVTNYLFSLDPTFTNIYAELIAPQVSTTLYELGGQQYWVYAKAISENSWSTRYDALNATPYYAGNMVVTATIPAANPLNTLFLTFTTPAVGNPAPNVYYYSLNNGITYTPISPSANITLTGLPNQTCNVVAYSTDTTTNWASAISNKVQITPYFASNLSITSVDSSSQTLIVKFSATTANPTPTRYYCALDSSGSANFIYSGTSSPIVIGNVASGSHTVYMKAVGNISGNVTIWTSNIVSSAGTPYTVGTKPTIQSIVPGLNQLTVNLNASTGGYPAPNYLFAYDSSFTTIVANVAYPNVVLPSLSNQQYTIYVKAIGGNIWSTAYDSSSATPYYAGNVTVSAVQPASKQLNTLILSFTTPVVGNPAPNVYYYSTNGGATYTPIAPTANVTVSDLPSQICNVVVYSANVSIWNSALSNSVIISPYYKGNAPTIIVGAGKYTNFALDFVPSVGYPSVTSYSYSTDGGNTFTNVGNITPPLTITLPAPKSYSFVIRATSAGYWTVDSAVYTVNVPCFLEGTKILRFNPNTREEEYVRVETLRQGDLIKTARSGYKPIHCIGSREIYNPSKSVKTDNRMYCYKTGTKGCTGLYEDLFVTGNHCALLYDVPEEKLEQIRQHMGDIYVTEGDYRVPACLDDRATAWNKEGQVIIWHFALEHESRYKNYGVYANGLLVESSSIRYMTELSGMKLLNK